MTWFEAGIWGLAGGAAIELVDLYRLVRPSAGVYTLPDGGSRFWKAYAIAVGIRLGLGFVTGWTLYDAEQIETSLAALFAGAGATGFLEHAGRRGGGPWTSEEEASKS